MAGRVDNTEISNGNANPEQSGMADWYGEKLADAVLIETLGLGPFLLLGLEDDVGGHSKDPDFGRPDNVTDPSALSAGELNDDNRWLGFGDVPGTAYDLPNAELSVGELDDANDWIEYGDASLGVNELPAADDDGLLYTPYDPQVGDSFSYDPGELPYAPPYDPGEPPYAPPYDPGEPPYAPEDPGGGTSDSSPPDP